MAQDKTGKFCFMQTGINKMGGNPVNICPRALQAAVILVKTRHLQTLKEAGIKLRTLSDYEVLNGLTVGGTQVMSSIDLDTACGWRTQQIYKRQLKGDFIQANEQGVRTFSSSPEGQSLALEYYVTYQKADEARADGIKYLSVGKSSLKTEMLRPAKVEQGSVRRFVTSVS